MIDLTPYTDSNGDIDLKKELIQNLAGIVTSGSNPNGTYIRFSDGTQICLMTMVVDMNKNTFQGTDYPATFSGGQPVSLSASYPITAITGASNYYYQNVKHISLFHRTSTFGSLLYTGTLQEVTGYAYIQAIGRWK